MKGFGYEGGFVGRVELKGKSGMFQLGVEVRITKLLVPFKRCDSTLYGRPFKAL
jgi:hypothetical protein